MESRHNTGSRSGRRRGRTLQPGVFSSVSRATSWCCAFLQAERRLYGTKTMRLVLFSIVMVLFCVLVNLTVYMKIYRTGSQRSNRVFRWTEDSNRNLKNYIKPSEPTLIHDARDVYQRSSRQCGDRTVHPLFLLIVVSSSTDNFEKRQLIRDTWGDYENYRSLVKMIVKEQNNNEYGKTDSKDSAEILYDNVHVTENLVYPYTIENIKAQGEEKNNEPMKGPDDFSQVSAISKNSKIEHEEDQTIDFDSSRFTTEENLKEIGSNANTESVNDDINEMSTVSPFRESTGSLTEENLDSELRVFKVVFMLGLPWGRNKMEVQRNIDEEAEMYGDIIQENFTDTYQNLTLKSVMILKWIVTHCDRNVRYILKADDDTYVSIVRLVELIVARASILRAAALEESDDDDSPEREYYIMGHIHSEKVPITDVNSKWYTPQYMYSGDVYPPYLAGAGYVLTGSAVAPLYRAAFTTPLFHIDDIFITGICAELAKPILRPMNAPGFMYTSSDFSKLLCPPVSMITAHSPGDSVMRTWSENAKKCERNELRLMRMLSRASVSAMMNTRLVFLNRLRNVVSQKQVFYSSS